MSKLDRHRERFRADPGDRRAFEALEENAFLAGDWAELVQVYEHRRRAPGLSREQRVALTFKLGQTWEERRRDPERAAACYRQVVGEDPRHQGALSQLRRIHRERGQWEVVLQIAEMEAALDLPRPQRAALMAETGAVWLEQLGDAEQAREHFRRALELDADQPVALSGAARAYQLCDQPREAAEVLERWILQLRPPERAPALVELARLQAGPLGSPERAVELFRQALTDDPRNPDAVEAMAQHAAARGQWPLLADLMERRFELSDDRVQRVGIAFEAGCVERDRLANPGAARVWFARAAELAPDDPDILEALAEFERECLNDDRLRELLARIAELRGSECGVALRIELASLHSAGGDDEAALHQLRLALERAPDDALVIEALSDTLARLQRDDELAELIERRAALPGADSASRAAAYAELGALQEERLDDVDAAIEAYSRSFEMDPGQSRVAHALERLYRKHERWRELAGFLRRAGRDGPAGERPRLLCALGDVLARRLGRREEAASCYELALGLDPKSLVAHRGLQQLAEESGSPDAVLAALKREAQVTTDRRRLTSLIAELLPRLEAAGRLSDALRWTERWAGVAPEEPEPLRVAARLHELLDHDLERVEVLEKLERLLHGPERATCRRLLAAHHDAQGRLEAAIGAARAALGDVPEDPEALAGWAELLERAGRWQELAEALRWQAEQTSGRERIDCWTRLVEVLGDRLGDGSAALEVLMRLAEEPEAPPEVEGWIEERLAQAERWEELALRLERHQAALDPGSAAAARLGLRRADLLFEQLGRFEAAASVYRGVLAAHPRDPAARRGLERSLRAEGEPAALAEFLADELNLAADPAARDRLALERAVLLEERLGESDAARSEYRRLADAGAEPELCLAASHRLEGLLERTGAWAALREHLESAPAGEDPELELARLQRLAALCRDRLGDPQRAIEHLERVVAAAPERASAWRPLQSLYEAAGRLADLGRALEAEISLAPDPDREQALRSRAAALFAGPLADPTRARRHYERLLELEPTHPTASEFLIEHWEQDGRYAAVVRLLSTRLDALEHDPTQSSEPIGPRRLALRLRIAGLFAGPLDDLDGAIATLEPLLGDLGAQAVIAEPLADLYQRAGYAEDYVELCRNAAALAADPVEEASWRIRLADFLRERGSSREAAETYREALDLRPEDRAIQAALRELYRELGDAEPLARLLEAELENRAGPSEVPLRTELAALLAGPLARPAEALEQLRRVLRIEPGIEEALDRALELADGLGVGSGDAPDSPEAAARARIVVELIDGALAGPSAPSRRARLLVRRARALEQLPGRAEEAVLGYRRALELDPGDREVARALRSLLARQGAWEGVLECLLLEAFASESGARAERFEEAAEIAERHLSPDASLPWLERLRTERPLDPEVPRRIADVHRRSERWEATLRALDDEIEVSAHGPRRRDLYVEQARVLEERFASPSRAAAALEGARRESPRDEPVLRDLDRLYRALSRPRERASVLESLVQAAGREEQVAVRCELAALYSDTLGAPERAADQLLRAVSTTPPGSALRTELLAALGECLRRAHRPDAWARCAEQELAALDPGAPVFRERRLELQRQLASVYEQELGRPDAAIAHLRSLVDQPPAAADAGGGETFRQAEIDLLRLLRGQQSWIELEQRLTAHLERQPANPAAWLELARLREERLSALAGAADAYRCVLDLEATSLPAIRGLRAVSERLGRFGEVAAMLERELEREDPGCDRGGLLRRLGDVCWRELGSTTRASRSYAAALESDPLDFEALHSLQRLLEEMEDFRGALDLYESEIEMLDEGEDARRQELWLRCGALAREHTRETARARRAYLHAAALGPLAVRQRFELAELHEGYGDLPAFCEVFTDWCDDPDANAAGPDHLRLAQALEKLERGSEALARVERALSLDPDLAPAWDLGARLREQRGEGEEAARALCRAAERVPDDQAASRLLRAAELTAEQDREGAAALLRTAARRDPGCAVVHARLALAVDALQRPEETEAEARLALDLSSRAEPGAGLDESLRLEVAIAGGRAAAWSERLEAAARFFSEALGFDPEHPEALAGYGSALADSGDLERAREVLERRLAHGDCYPERATHLAVVGRALEQADEPEAAIERYEQSLREDPRRDAAHERLVRIHEQAEQLGPGIAALERWADAAREPAQRAERLLRAAAWELRVGGHEDSAERHLREVLETSPRSASTWEALAQLLWDRDRVDEALEIATRALEALEGDESRAPLALIRGRALERRGERRPAAEAFRLAAEADPSCAEAALASARLLRGLGEWRAAAAALERFDLSDAAPAPSELAEVLHQHARLAAGPLEDVATALRQYRRAVTLAPERRDIRCALAELLSHSEGGSPQTLAELRTLLAAEPADPDVLRILLRVARARGPEATDRALALLAALGLASPADAEAASRAEERHHALPERLEGSLDEALRQLALEASEEIATALEASDTPQPLVSADRNASFRAEITAAEGRLSCPALVPLPLDELREVLTLVATLALDPDQVRGQGARVNALSTAIGRRTRRRLRRLLGETGLDAVQALDFAAWRRSLRALAAGQALVSARMGLREALVALLRDDEVPVPDALDEGADLTPYLREGTVARALVRLAVIGCLESL